MLNFHLRAQLIHKLSQIITVYFYLFSLVETHQIKRNISLDSCLILNHLLEMHVLGLFNNTGFILTEWAMNLIKRNKLNNEIKLSMTASLYASKYR